MTIGRPIRTGGPRAGGPGRGGRGGGVRGGAGPRSPFAPRPAVPGPRRRSGPWLTPLRAGALLVMALSVVAGWGLVATPLFAFRGVELADPVPRFTERAAIEATVAEVAGTDNVFLLDPDAVESALAALPAVESAEIEVGLPGTLRVTIREREAVVSWLVGGRRYVVDGTGLVLAVFPVGDPGPAGRLVAVIDDRASGRPAAVGDRIDPLLIDVATRLGSLTTGDVGTARPRLRIVLDDTDGFTLQPVPAGPVAVFGFYTATIRTPELVPGQVRLLRSLLLGREAKIGRVVLASDTRGTYLPRGVDPEPLPIPTPSPTPDPSPGAGTSTGSGAAP